MSKPAILMIEAAGLIITAALLFVIALTLKLSLWLTTLGTLAPDLGVLAFGFLFYVCAGFLSAGTRDRPAHPSFVVANVALHAAFLGAAWLLWRPALSGAWLGFGVALSTSVHAAVWLAARYRARLIRALLRWPAARPAASVESVFQAHTAPYRAMPIGAGLGALVGTLLQAPTPDRLRHIAAGVFAALALDALGRLVAGGVGLCRALVSEADVTRVEARRLGASVTDPLRVLVPRDGSSQARLEAVVVAAALRRVLLANQLARVLVLYLGSTAFFVLELPTRQPGLLLLMLLPLTLAATLGSFQRGQRATQQQLLRLSSGEGQGQQDVGAESSLFAATGAVVGAGALGILAAHCALPVVLELLR